MKTKSAIGEFFCCDKFDITNELYNSFYGFMAGMNRTDAWSKQNWRETWKGCDSSISLASYKILCHIFLSYSKPENMFDFKIYIGVIFYGTFR